MNARSATAPSQAILLLAPLAEDEAALCDIVQGEGEAATPATVATFAATLAAGAGGVLMTEEALSEESLQPLSEWAAAQPEWSSLPVLILTRDAGRRPRLLARLVPPVARSGMQVSFLQRPSSPDVLRNAIRNAIAERRRQYVIRDQIEDLKARQERVTMLGRETQHRAKNSLAKLSAMLRLTWRESASPEEFIESYQHRISATARGLDLMSQTHWRGATLADLFETEARALFGEKASERLRCTGETIPLDYEAALALHLVAHELTTNALKYGAYSTPAGRVDVRWRRAGKDGGERLELEWKESGGPPVSEPERKGFGSRIVGEALAMQIGGEVVTAFDPDGLSCRIVLQMNEIRSDNKRSGD